MIVRDKEYLKELQWTCENTSEKLRGEASSRHVRLNNEEFTLLYNGNIVRGNKQVKSVGTSRENPLIAITNRTKGSKNS